jgi:hypothetical protein
MASVLPLPAFAWGATGHRLISEVAIETLPATLPAFVRSPAAIAEIEALGPEADRLKGSGKEWDEDEDHGHFVDIGDDGKIAGVVSIDALPADREDYDTALRKAGADQYKMGYLPYQIVDGYEQLVTDFAYWRVAAMGETSAPTAEDRAYFAAERARREMLTLRDIGYWSHFVGDASQPLHTSVHYNGWGDGPNTMGFSNSHSIHARFETALVRGSATDALVAARVPAYVLDPAPINVQVAHYLHASLAGVPRVYQLEQRGEIDAKAKPAVDFMLDRLAAGATMLRDLTTEAWTESATRDVGYPKVSVGDIVSGKVVPTKAMFGGD